MTLSVANQYPASGAVNVSPSTRPKFDIVTDDFSAPATLSSVNVWLDGSKVIASGVPVDGHVISDNGLGGFNIVLAPRTLALDEDTSSIRVTAQDSNAASIDVSWSFTVADDSGPYLLSSTPAAFAIATASPTAFDFTIRDDGAGYDPLLRVTDFSDTSLDMTGNVISFTPFQDVGEKNSFELREGSLFEVTSGAETGEIRRITVVRGPGVAEYSGAALTSAAETFTVYRQRGLDVWIDGTRVVGEGYADPDAVTAGWAASVSTLGSGDLFVDVTAVPVSWTRGYRIPISIRASDDNTDRVNVSEINFWVMSQNDMGPFVDNLSPARDSTGLGLSSNLAFDITAPDGVDSSTLNVLVNGASAISAGVGAGNWSTSTVTPITNGFTVSLVPTVAYADGEIVFVDISASDTPGYAMPRHVYSVQFGTATGDRVVGSLTNVVRVTAFDLSQTSFAKPKELGHNGFAYDGRWYVNGSRDGSVAVASWHTESGDFPISGCLVATSAGGWDVFGNGEAAAWMSSSPIVGSGWSMAGNSADTVNDAAFGPDAELAVFTDSAVIVTSFVDDKAYRYDTSGKTVSTGNVSQRDGDQAGGLPDSTYTLPAGPYAKGAMVAWQDGSRSRITALASASGITIVNELSADELTALQAARTVTSTPDAVVSQAVSGTMSRIDMGRVYQPEVLLPLAYAANDGGQGTVYVGDWFDMLADESPAVMLDDVSTPAIPASDVNDIDIDITSSGSIILAVVTDAQVDVIDVDYSAQASSQQLSLSLTDMGLNGIASSSASAVAMETDADVDGGYMYAAVAAPADGRVTHVRIHGASEPGRTSAVVSGTPYTSIAALGVTKYLENPYVRTSMKLIDP